MDAISRNKVNTGLEKSFVSKNSLESCGIILKPIQAPKISADEIFEFHYFLNKTK